VEYYRYNRRCSFAPNDTEIQKQFAIKKKLDGEIKKTEAKAARLYKQRRLILKHLRDLGDRKSANIIKLEAEEHRAIFSELNKINLSFSVLSPGALSDFSEFLAQEYPDLSGKNLPPIIRNS
jgi:hypothetical protein